MLVNKLDSNFIIKTMVSCVLIPLVIGAIIFSKLLLSIILIVVAIGMFFEWYDMTGKDKYYMLSGLPVISIPIASLLLIPYSLPEYHYILLTYAVIIWTVDILAMIGGQMIGGVKLAPRVSPRKTWSGLISGIVGAAILVQIMPFLPGYEFPYQGIALSLFALLLGALSQVSDLFISLFKRKFHLKDSGNILPGHGGILDRIDSMILTAPILLYVVL